MDKTNLDQIRLRSQMIENHGNTVVDANEIIAPAVNEFYTWMMGTDLLLRYPMMFQVVQNTDSVPEKRPQPLLTSLTIAETITIGPPATAIEALRLPGPTSTQNFFSSCPHPTLLTKASTSSEAT
jgi:hypothetical protein